MKLNLKRFSTGGGDESTTTNLGLSKPLSSDTYNIAIQNSNMDKIDNAVAALEQRMTVVRAELWTNSNPTAKFPSKTISIPNLSSYDEIEVFFYNWGGGQHGIQSTKCPVANGNAFHFSFTINLFDGSNNPTTPHFGARLNTMNTTNNTITFGNQFGVVGNSWTTNSDQQWGIPIKIVGWRYE